MNEKFDVIVIGLGAMGSATTYQLAKRNAKVLGIDQFAPPHQFGSSHGESRITRLAIGEGEYLAPLALRSHQIWKDIGLELNANLLNLTGGLYISSESRSTDAHVSGFFDRTVSTAQKLGIAHELLDAKGIRKRFPQFKVKDDEYGYFEPETGFLRPESCIKANLDLARKHGAKLITNQRVQEYNSDNEVTVKTSKSSFKSKSLVITNGAWVNQFVPNHSIFKIYRQLLFWFDISEEYQNFKEGSFPIFIWESQGTPCFWYGFPAIDGANGGLKLSTESFETTLDDPAKLNRDVSTQEIDFMYKTYVTPHLDNVSSKCIKASACMYTVTPDFQFVIDRHPTDKNVHLVSACSGHGFKHSAAIGEVIAQKLTGEKNNIDLDKFSMQRFN